MRARLEFALNDILHQMDAGKSLEQCLEGYAPELAEELRALVEMTAALQTLRAVPPPRAEARAANRQRFLDHAAAVREARAPAAAAAGGVWQWVRGIFSRPTWREAMYAASLTLVLGLLMLFGVGRGMNWLQNSGGETPSRTEVVRVDETQALPSVAPSLAPSPAVSPEQEQTPDAVGTRSAQMEPATSTATPAPTLQATPVVEPPATQATTLPIVISPAPTGRAASPTPSATKQPATPTPTRAQATVLATPSPTATRTPTPLLPAATPTPALPSATPTRTAAPATPTEEPPPPATATDEPPEPTATPERPTATFTPAPPTNTPTRRPTLPPTPVETIHPEPTLVLTIVPAVQPTVTPPR